MDSKRGMLQCEIKQLYCAVLCCLAVSRAAPRSSGCWEVSLRTPCVGQQATGMLLKNHTDQESRKLTTTVLLCCLAVSRAALKSSGCWEVSLRTPCGGQQAWNAAVGKSH